MKENILKNVSFHDEEIIDVIVNNNNNITIIAIDDMKEEYIFEIKNYRIEKNAIINIEDIKGKEIMSLSYNDKEKYVHLELFNNNSPFTDDFYIYSDNIKITKNTNHF